MRLALVTGNTHKLQEFVGILDGLDCQLPLEELDVEGVVECGATYYQNAYRKARAGLLSIRARDAADCVVLADDSGLELPLFGGMPGVHSARFRYAGLSERACARGVSHRAPRIVNACTFRLLDRRVSSWVTPVSRLRRRRCGDRDA